jgi:hypothetical protein
MMRRILLGGLLGGLAMFIWTSIAHMVLPLGAAGIREIPNDADMVNALHTKLGESSGFYMYPGMGTGGMAGYAQKLAANPSGLLIYHPPGVQTLTPGQLVTELLTEIAEALLVAWLLTQTRLAGYGSRVVFALVCGILAAIATNVSYWNWYGFPASYTIATMTTEVVGVLVAGLVVAKFVVPVKA